MDSAAPEPWWMCGLWNTLFTPLQCPQEREGADLAGTVGLSPRGLISSDLVLPFIQTCKYLSDALPDQKPSTGADHFPLCKGPSSRDLAAVRTRGLWATTHLGAPTSGNHLHRPL